MEIEPRHIVLLLVFAAVFALGQAVWGLATAARTRLRVNRRLVLQQQGGGGLADLVVELRKQRGLNADGERRGLAWLGDLITRSGVPYQPRKWAMMIAGGAVIAGALAFAGTHNPLIAACAAGFAAAVGPLGFLKIMAGRRAKALGVQLPQALEIVVRSLEAGHPVASAVALVGREMADPIGSEFGMAADEIAFGATLAQAVGRIAQRCQHEDVDLFAATIRLQERSGGNLVGLLRTNAATIRERVKMRLKIKAASSEGRAAAIILTSAPFVVMALLQVVSPTYYGDVIQMRGVQIGLGCCAVWIGIGNLVMRRMIDMRI
jgi:tight adherence protein B